MRFRGASSIVAVCAFCRATLVREGVNLENIGKQAELLEDDSPIRIGADGKHRGVGFTVVGRLQYRYGAGVWSEWHVLFPGGKSAWLSDASREYTLTYLVPPSPLPAYENVKPNQKLLIPGDKWYSGTYTVTNVDSAEVVAGEGELPFRWTSGYHANVVDLRGDGARFATIDYSQSPPHLYVGEKLPFDSFSFSGLRDPDRVGFTKGTATSFKCAGCGAPIEKRLTTTEVVACDSCGSVTDVKGPVGAIVQKNERNTAKVKPYLPLGTVGRWKNVRYEVMGFMRRSVLVDGLTYSWGEYLLHNVEQGYAWVTEYDGHFNFVKSAAEIPKETSLMGVTSPAVRYLGKTFRHFSRSSASVSYLTGEFYWRVMLGDVARCNDYVDPPLMLSSESTSGEISWSLGEYVDGPELFKAFNLKSKPPLPVGVAPNQPSPHKGKVARYWAAFIGFAIIGLLAQMLFSMFQSSVKPEPQGFAWQAGQTSHTTGSPFKLGGFGNGRATVRTTTDLQEGWLSLDMQLVDADNGRAYGLKRQLAFQDIGGVKDGSSEDVAEIAGVPPGRYTLTIDAVAPKGANENLRHANVQVYRSEVDWSNFWLFTGYLFLWPLGAWLRARAFETKRWSESDYAAGSDDEDSSSSTSIFGSDDD